MSDEFQDDSRGPGGTVFLARDTGSIIRGIGGDDQLSGRLDLVQLLVPVVSVGDPLQLIPQAAQPTVFVRLFQPSISGLRSVMEMHADFEWIIWSMDSLSTPDIRAWIEPLDLPSNITANLIDPSGVSPMKFIYGPHTFRPLSGTANTAPDPNTPRLGVLIQSFNAGNYRRIPRSHRLVIWTNAQDLIDVSMVLSQIGPTQTLPP